MPKSLPDESKIHISCDKMRSERVLQNMRMPLLRRQGDCFGMRTEDAEELGSVQFASFLACEKKIGTIFRTIAEPAPQCFNLIEQWLTAMRVQRLRLAH